MNWREEDSVGLLIAEDEFSKEDNDILNQILKYQDI